MADFDQQQFEKALDKFYDKLASLSGQTGRGGKTGGTSGSESKTEKAAAFKAALSAKESKLLEKSIERQRLGQKLSEKQEKLLKEFNDIVGDTTDAMEKLKREQEKQTEGLKDFGKELLLSSDKVDGIFTGLKQSFSGSSTVLGKAVYGFAAGAGFAMGAMADFAKAASELGGFADLSAFSVGAVRQATLMSSLGTSFKQVIADSNGGFKAFGNSSQEAVSNLSNLSRGLRLGAGATARFGMSLSKDMAANMNKASIATAAMGLSQEDQAGLMGNLSSVIQLTAKNEKQAQEMLVKQYAETVESARTLSNTFGVSSKEILKSIENFNKSTSGQAAALQGVSGSTDIKAALQAAGVSTDENVLNRMALNLAKGQEGAARAYAAPEAQANLQAVIQAVRSAKETGGGVVSAKGMAAGMQQQAGTFRELGAQRADLAVTQNTEAWFDAGINAASLAKRLELQARATAGDVAAQKELSKSFKTSEASNVQTMDQLQGSLDYLRAAIIGLTAGIVGLTGMLAPLVMGGAGAFLMGGKGAGGALGGALGTVGKGIGGMLGKGADAVGGVAKTVAGGFTKSAAGEATTKAAGAAVGGFEKLSTATAGPISKAGSAVGSFLESLGTTGAIKGAATLALLGAALGIAGYGFKQFNEVDWTSLVKGAIAIGILGVAMTALASVSIPMLIGAAAIAAMGAAMWVASIGFEAFNKVEWDSLAKGTLALAALGLASIMLVPAVLPLLLLAVPLMAFGAGLKIFAGGVEAFNDVNWDSFAKGTVALAAFGLLSTFMMPAVAPLLLLSIPLIAFGFALTMFADGVGAFNTVDWGSLIKGTLALGAFGVLSAFLVPAMAPMLLLAVPMIAFGFALKIFAGGVEAFNDVDWGSLIKGTLALGAFGVLSAFLVPAVIPLLLLAVPLMAFGFALTLFAGGIEEFNNVDWESLAKGTSALHAFGVASVFLLPFLIPLALAAVPLLAFGAGLSAFALGVKQFNDVDWDSVKEGTALLGSLAWQVAGLGLLLPAIVLGSLAMGVLGAGISLLVATLPAADVFDNFADSLKTVGEVNGANLIAIGAGLAAMGTGAVIFAAGMAAATAGSVLTGIMGLFGAKSPLERVMEFVPYADAISALGQGILNFGNGIIAIKAGLDGFDGKALDAFRDKLLDFAAAGSSDELRLTAEYLTAIGASMEQIGKVGDISLPTVPSSAMADLGGGTPAGTTTVGSPAGAGLDELVLLLSNIQNDIAAIRSNTRAQSSTAPVRLG